MNNPKCRIRPGKFFIARSDGCFDETGGITVHLPNHPDDDFFAYRNSSGGPWIIVDGISGMSVPVGFELLSTDLEYAIKEADRVLSYHDNAKIRKAFLESFLPHEYSPRYAIKGFPASRRIPKGPSPDAS